MEETDNYTKVNSSNTCSKCTKWGEGLTIHLGILIIFIRVQRIIFQIRQYCNKK